MSRKKKQAGELHPNFPNPEPVKERVPEQLARYMRASRSMKYHFMEAHFAAARMYRALGQEEHALREEQMAAPFVASMSFLTEAMRLMGVEP